MQKIISPIDKEILLSELTKDKFLRDTNYDKNQIYLINYHDSPNTMREIGRLRELTFRYAGGGTGNEVDIDEYDTHPIYPYQQLIVWNPYQKEIVGGYRFLNCSKVKPDSDGSFHHVATTHLFQFSQKFIDEFLPFTIELGRSFVQPNYQPSSTNRKGIFSLDNIWDGLGAIIVDNPTIKYFFGKFTMYLSYNIQARDMILFFLKKHFPDKDRLVFPHNALPIYTDINILHELFTCDSYQEDYKILNTNVRQLNENIPPLVNTYMNISPSMRTFGTSLNDTFGEVEETGIMVTINDIYPQKKERHIYSYSNPK